MFTCEYCGKEFIRPVSSGHKRFCDAFLAAVPAVDRIPPACLCGHTSTSFTQMKRHRKNCSDWELRDKDALALSRIKDTLKRKYGDDVTNAIHIPGAKERQAETNMIRYGAPCTLSKESSLYETVQSYWDGKDRASHFPEVNPFTRPEIKAKIKKYWQDNYGVNDPTQVPEIRARQLATTKAKYGDEQALRVPVIRQKGLQTMLERYGVEYSSQSPELLEKVKSTNMKRWGVKWSTQNQEVQKRLRESHFAKFGNWYGATDEWKTKFYEKIEETQAKVRATSIERFGYDHFMKNPDLARAHLENSKRRLPNNLELKFHAQFPQLVYTGDGKYWRYLPLLGKNSNPDFIMPGHDPEHPFSGATKIVETFGDYWHSERQTGKPCSIHEMEVIAAWADVGMQCYVIWEHELSNDKYVERVQHFLDS